MASLRSLVDKVLIALACAAALSGAAVLARVPLLARDVDDLKQGQVRIELKLDGLVSTLIERKDP